MKKIFALVFVFGLFSCQKKAEKIEEKKCSSGKEKKLEMYQMSEMATLMEQMYAYNLQIKNRIIKGDTLGKFPEFFNKIYTANSPPPSTSPHLLVIQNLQNIVPNRYEFSLQV
jgi:hypothetical protein